MDIDWKALFLSTRGRITRQSYWIGWGAQFVASILLSLILTPISIYLRLVVGLALLYPMYCVYAKRLQDLGKPGTLALVPVATALVASAMSVYVVATLGIKPGFNPMAGMNPEDMAGKLGPMMAISGVNSLLGIIGLVFWLWLGIAQGQEGPNAFGPDPRDVDSAEVF